MSEFVEAANRQDLKSGEMKAVKAAGKEILLARVGDTFYATQSRCPHMGGSLTMGTLEKTIVTCPRHRSQFDLTDGKILTWTDWTGMKLTLAKMFKSPRPLKTYKVRVDGDKIMVALD
jgi:3-phenylpropionate/trans-cinnamate dioxygenase ferredoxin subunit